MLNIFNSIINLFKMPVTTTNKQAEEATLKNSFIKSGIISAVFFICTFITCFFNEVISKSYDYKKGKYIQKFNFDSFDFEDVITPAITTLIGVFIVLLVVAGVMYIISRILKNENSYAKLLTISANAFIPVSIASIISLLTSWLYSPIGMITIVAASVYMLFIMVFSFRNTLTIENEDKLVLLYVAITTIIFTVLYFIISIAFKDLLDIFNMF